MIVRPAQAADADGIARVHVGVWRTTYAGIVPDNHLAGLSYERCGECWRKVLADASSPRWNFVAEGAGGQIVGFASAGPESSGDADLADFPGELYAIYVLASHQRQGLGRRMMAAAAGWLREQGYGAMMVWVLADNPSRAFYVVLGGEYLREQVIEIGGAALIEVAYGWREIGGLIVATGGG